jgi:hypothetical protein
MRYDRTGLLAPAIVGTLHFVLCLAMFDFLSRPHGESWGWFPIFVLDFPMSILILSFFEDVPPLLTYGVLGSIWWALLALSVLTLFRRLK